MKFFLNTLLIATILVIGIALWQAFRIIKAGKDQEKLSEQDQRKVERRFTVLQVGIYVIIVIIVLRFCLNYLTF